MTALSPKGDSRHGAVVATDMAGAARLTAVVALQRLYPKSDEQASQADEHKRSNGNTDGAFKQSHGATSLCQFP
jgi:hypothetical protein